MIFKDYYKILGLETNKIDNETVKLAYREVAKKHHPDLNIGNKLAEEKFKDANEAYKVLTNASAKRKYDKIWTSHMNRINKAKAKQEAKKKGVADVGAAFEGNTCETDQLRPPSKQDPITTKQKIDSLFSDFFNIFFGEKELTNETKNKTNKSLPPVKGENIETEIIISIEEAFYGMQKKVQLRNIDGKMKVFSIKIPEGIKDGSKIRLQGLGKPGQNGGSNGNLIIKVKIENTNKFRLEGNDLIKELMLTPWEAVLGTRIDMQYVDGNAVIYVPPGIQNGEKIKIPKKGYKDEKGGRGDLIAEIKIVIPKSPTEEERALFQKLDEISTYNPRNSH